MKIGDLVEIAGRKYDVVSDKHGGVALESPITKTVTELLAKEGLALHCGWPPSASAGASSHADRGCCGQVGGSIYGRGSAGAGRAFDGGSRPRCDDVARTTVHAR